MIFSKHFWTCAIICTLTWSVKITVNSSLSTLGYSRDSHQFHTSSLFLERDFGKALSHNIDIAFKQWSRQSRVRMFRLTPEEKCQDVYFNGIMTTAQCESVQINCSHLTIICWFVSEKAKSKYTVTYFEMTSAALSPMTSHQLPRSQA